MTKNGKISILLTVPHLVSTSSPYREVIALAKYLDFDRFQLTVCALREDGYEETAPYLGKLGVDSFVAKFRPRGRRLRGIWSSIRDERVIKSQGNFAIQHSMDWTSSPFEAVISRLAKRTFVFTQRDLLENGHPNFLRLKIRLAEGIVAISNPVEHILHQYGADPNKIFRIPLGIDVKDISFQIQGNDPDRDFFLVVSHFERRKRHVDAIRAFGLLCDEFPRIKLKLAGQVYDQEVYAELLELVRRLRLQDRVEFLGVRKDILDLMRQAVALVMCSESEAIPWVTIEAMATGCPVIVSDIEAHKELVSNGKTGFMVKLYNVQALANAMKGTLRLGESCNVLVTNARRLIEERFSASYMASQMMDFYREVYVRAGTAQKV
jgi:glycosyltransferase involved in cell wall biosynthesis